MAGRPKADWIGIIGTGQSLSVGAQGQPILSIAPSYDNLKLSTGNLVWPVSADDPKLELVPLTEPIGQYAPTYPSSWPQNIDGETPHTSMASEITALALAKFGKPITSVHVAVGEDGQGIKYLKKGAPHDGLNGRSFESAMIATRAINRLAQQAHKSFIVGGLLITHGETDCGNKDYSTEMLHLWADYNADVKAITGQKDSFKVFVSQQNSILDRAPSTQTQWRLGVEHPEAFACVGPKYQYPYAEDRVHLLAAGYRLLGEKAGQAFFQSEILGKKWRPLEPTEAKLHGNDITVRFHVPVGPLVWDEQMSAPHAGTPEWSNGKGFEVLTEQGGKVAIASVEIGRDHRSVTIHCQAGASRPAVVAYALYGEKVACAKPAPGTIRWGLLRDSDPFIGSVSKTAQPNYCVAFELPLAK